MKIKSKRIPKFSVKLEKKYIGLPPPKKPKKFKSAIDRLIWQLDTTPEPKFGGRTLKAGWTIDVEQDIVSMQGIDIEEELVNGLSLEIAKEIDERILHSI